MEMRILDTKVWYELDCTGYYRERVAKNGGVPLRAS